MGKMGDCVGNTVTKPLGDGPQKLSNPFWSYNLCTYRVRFKLAEVAHSITQRGHLDFIVCTADETLICTNLNASVD